MKEDAIPTIFEHKNLPQKRKTSLERETRTSKKVIVEDAISDFQKQVGLKEISCDTEDLIQKRDFGINNAPTVRSIRTQWRKEHVTDSEGFSFPSREPTKIKFVKPKPKATEIGINTDLTFSPNANVLISSDGSANFSNDHMMHDHDEVDSEDSDSTFSPSDASQQSDEDDDFRLLSLQKTLCLLYSGHVC